MPPESVRSARRSRLATGVVALLAGLAPASVGCSVDTRANARAKVARASQPPRALCRPWTAEPCLTRVGASLLTEHTRRPVAGKRLWFFSHGTMICSSVTDDAGIASCHGLAPSGRELAGAGYSVVVEQGADVPMRVVQVR